MKKLFCFNRQEMQEYINKFNYLDVKYNSLLNECDETIKPFLKKAFCDYEASKPHTIYNKINYARFKEKINLIYRDEDVAREMVSCFDFAISNLIDRYLNISPLNKLFNEHFIEFEWLQHVELNFDKLDLKFYRDHFIHQIRNCYMILRLLDDSVDKKSVNLMKKIQQVLKSKNSELAKYACVCVGEYEKYIRRSIDEIFSRESMEGAFFDHIKLHISNTKQSSISAEELSQKSKEISSQMYKNIEEFSWEYFIRGSLIIASLFHDIGYPIQYIKACSDILNDFIASIVRQDNFNFERLNDILGSSLLFTIVEKEELRRSFEKPEHGALSAFALLLHFYETGTIHSLNPIKKAMVEFAALMIFDHTIDYTEDPTKTKPSFAKNPLSYALRLVDDLQEWDRVYFEIRQNSDLRYCEKCKMPIGRVWNKEIESKILNKIIENVKGRQEYNNFLSSKESEKLDMIFPDSQMKRVYICGCNIKKRELDFADFVNEDMNFSSGIYENGSLFPYTKLNYTIISDNVTVVDESVEQNNKLRMLFYLDYDPFRELYLLMINPKALDYRMGEMCKLNKQFDFQRDLDFSMKTYMTNNPVMLKLRILIHFIYEIGAYLVYKENFDVKVDKEYFNPKYNNFQKILDEIPREKFQLILSFVSMLQSKAKLLVYDYSYEYQYEFDDSINISDIKKYLSEVMSEVMSKVIKTIMNGVEENEYINNLVRTIDCYLELAYMAIEEKNDFNAICSIENLKNAGLKDASEILIYDVLKQFKYLREDDNLTNYYKCVDKESYGKVLKESVSIFMKDENYDPSIISLQTINTNNKFTYVDLKSDLYLFKEMYRFTRDSYKRRQKIKKKNDSIAGGKVV